MSAWFKETLVRFANLDAEDVVRRLITGTSMRTSGSLGPSKIPGDTLLGD